MSGFQAAAGRSEAAGATTDLPSPAQATTQRRQSHHAPPPTLALFLTTTTASTQATPADILAAENLAWTHYLAGDTVALGKQYAPGFIDIEEEMRRRSRPARRGSASSRSSTRTTRWPRRYRRRGRKLAHVQLHVARDKRRHFRTLGNSEVLAMDKQQQRRRREQDDASASSISRSAPASCEV
jgi:hypothetical protein